MAQSDEDLDRLKKKGAGVVELNVARAYRHWALALVDFVGSGRKPEIEIPIQAISIGERLAIVAIPAETFCETGLEIKAKSPFKDTLAIGYSNGCVSYIPTADAYPPEGWSITARYAVPDLIFQGYLLPTALRPDCSDLVVRHSLELLQELKREQH